MVDKTSSLMEFSSRFPCHTWQDMQNCEKRQQFCFNDIILSDFTLPAVLGFLKRGKLCLIAFVLGLFRSTRRSFPRKLYCRMPIPSISLTGEVTFRSTMCLVSKTSKSCGRRGGLGVNAIDSGSSSPCLNPGRGPSVGQHTSLSQCLSPPRNK